MKRSEIEDKLRVLKMDYARIQGDVEKLESVGGDAKPALNQLEQMELEIKTLKKELRSLHQD
ncbi:SE1832 family protein [Alteribacillus iranensis]|uniref:Uncharacterized protein n=1 Tax=Alteribacillus iranensis TaxID=930128 RepID=A0A1I2FCI0_9BACI|nr:SE1832 family protein [Alteribacillus iranensis]SFF02477.1 hypothetical protein SAMN05192532_11048 [Alteribacillus iranensis]